MTEKQIAKQVKAALKAKKWTIYRLEKESGVKNTAIKTVLNADAQYTVTTLLKICNALEIESIGNVKEPTQI